MSMAVKYTQKESLGESQCTTAFLSHPSNNMYGVRLGQLSQFRTVNTQDFHDSLKACVLGTIFQLLKFL